MLPPSATPAVVTVHQQPAVGGEEGRRQWLVRGSGVEPQQMDGTSTTARNTSSSSSGGGGGGPVAWLTRTAVSVFLPAGYPASVSDDYLAFQAYDSLQAASSYLRGVLTTHAVLVAAGVGSDTASALSATLTWLLRDASGMLGSLVFAWWGGHGRFDDGVKQWRLFADVANDVGLTLEMLSPAMGSPLWFAVTACLARVCQGLCGVAAGATRSVITAHFARANNLGDVAVKESSQETAVTLASMVAGMALMTVLQAAPLLFFAALTVVHVWANYRAVTSLQLRTLNAGRADVVVTEWLRTRRVPTPAAAGVLEPLSPWARWGAAPWAWVAAAVRVRWGPTPCVTLAFPASFQQLWACVGRDGAALAAVAIRYRGEGYAAAAWPAHTPTAGTAVRVAIAVAPNAAWQARLQAYTQAVVFRNAMHARRHSDKRLTPHGVTAALDDALATARREVGALLAACGARGWCVTHGELAAKGLRVRLDAHSHAKRA